MKREIETEGVGRPPPAVSPRLARPAPLRHRRKLPHYERVGATYFLTFVTANRWTLPETARSAVLDACAHDHGRRYYLHAAVVMPDHAHLLLTPMRDTGGNTFGLVEIVGAIKGASSHAVNKAVGRRGRVWQQEWFDTLLRGADSLRQKAEYIWENPVQAGIVARPGEYCWRWPREGAEQRGFAGG